MIEKVGLKPRISPKFDAISLDTSNPTSSQTKWVYLQKLAISISTLLRQVKYKGQYLTIYW